MSAMGMFVGCGTIRSDSGVTVEVHAGVLMELISGGSTMGTTRVIVRSTLTRETFRVHPMLVERVLVTPEIAERIVDVACDHV